jgi:hypothetical protein
MKSLDIGAESEKLIMSSQTFSDAKISSWDALMM